MIVLMILFIAKPIDAASSSLNKIIKKINQSDKKKTIMKHKNQEIVLTETRYNQCVTRHESQKNDNDDNS